MYELAYLYEQLKTQTVEKSYAEVLNESALEPYDILEMTKNVNETMLAVEEASKKKKFDIIKKLKSKANKAKKSFSKLKDKATKVKPFGLKKEFTTIVSDECVKSIKESALDYLNRFNLQEASEDELKTFIKESLNNTHYREIKKIFGNGKERFSVSESVMESSVEREVSREDIANAINFLETSFDSVVDSFVRQDSNIVFTKDRNDLRQTALNHKACLECIVEDMYQDMMFEKLDKELNESYRIVVKAANYNPRDLRESAKIQYYIDSLFE